MYLVKKLFKFVLAVLFLIVIGIFILYLNLRNELPNIEYLQDIKWQTPMQIYSNDGLLISQFGEKKRIPLTFNEIPQQLIDALLATEDDRFYFHFGVDPIGMARAVLGQITGEDRGGASTITMQVARNFFLTREQTYIRKIREIFLTFHIESLLTKNEILTLYVNKIPLGHRSFGFGAAAQVYYGKNITDLNLAQIAVLAGLPKAPSTYNPISRPERAKIRRTTVLQRMLVSGYITKQEYLTSKNAPITGKRHGTKIELSAPYVAEMAHQKMIAMYGKEAAYTAGYKVFTTVTSRLQSAAYEAVTDNLFTYDQRHGYRGAELNLRQVQKEKSSNPIKNKKNLPIDISPITTAEITTALSHAHYDHLLEPAVVTQVDKRSVNITLRKNKQAKISWSGLSWARAYINDRKQGPVPKQANKILAIGDVILVNKGKNGDYQLSQLPVASAAMISLSPDNGAIKAAVGG
ncbi:MAG: transglycosylase domain-containing protein, partial [Colwellia sp.]|nr:transglycosylase domain-containing protein [Colwellia sp.]